MNSANPVQLLQAMCVPNEVLHNFPCLPADLDGLLVYGSQARGDAVAGSDLDLIGIVETSRPSTHSGVVNVSYYTLEQLSTGLGTLFGAHLKRDGKILWERDRNLTTILQAMGEVDTQRLLSRVFDMSTLFTCKETDLPRYLPGLLRQARYLLRSCLYAQSIADGNPSFSVRELAIRHNDSRLAQLLASRQEAEPRMDDYERCLLRLSKIVGEFSPNKHGSLEATVVNEWGNPSDVLSMAYMALGTAGEGSDYAEVQRILL
ncbi:hypothetical protein GCM10009616_28780 [Microlunatus lacustris]